MNRSHSRYAFSQCEQSNVSGSDILEIAENVAGWSFSPASRRYVTNIRCKTMEISYSAHTREIRTSLAHIQKEEIQQQKVLFCVTPYSKRRLLPKKYFSSNEKWTIINENPLDIILLF